LECESKSVRCNIKRFYRNDFIFEITKEELSSSQIVTLYKGRGSNIKYLPFAFDICQKAGDRRPPTGC
jgi:hypothetical protein